MKIKISKWVENNRTIEEIFNGPRVYLYDDHKNRYEIEENVLGEGVIITKCSDMNDTINIKPNVSNQIEIK